MIIVDTDTDSCFRPAHTIVSGKWTDLVQNSSSTSLDPTNGQDWIRIIETIQENHGFNTPDDYWFS
jgi:hypothetical protein